MRKIAKIHMKCPKIVCGWGSAPDPVRGAYGSPSDLLVGLGRVHAPSTLFHSYYKPTLG